MTESKKILTNIELSSLAGKARAAKLSPERRSEIAKIANNAKNTKGLVKATHDGSIEIGNGKLECYVLKDGTRILSNESIAKCLGFNKPNSERQKKEESTGVPYFMGADNIKSLISAEMMSSLKVINFSSKKGTKASGVNAILFPEICDLFLKARDLGILTEQQKHIAQSSEIMIRSLAKIGIIALIDEATGYEEERARGELQTLLKKIISDELLPWTQTFPHEFFRNAYRLFGWKYKEGQCQHPQYMGGFINKFIYDAISPEVRKELQSKNPFDPEKNCNKHKHHQFLTHEYGRGALEKQLMTVIGLMRASRCKEEFEGLFDRVFKGTSQLDWICQFM